MHSIYMAIGQAVIQREMLTEALWSEVMPLLTAHYHEIAHYPDIELNPWKERYFTLQDNGALRLLVARDEGGLIGYLAVLVTPHLHYADSLTASQDVLFVRNDHRGLLLGRDLIRAAEEMLRAEGVQVFSQHCKVRPDIDVGRLFRAMGYEPMDMIYVKRLDR